MWSDGTLLCRTIDDLGTRYVQGVLAGSTPATMLDQIDRIISPIKDTEGSGPMDRQFDMLTYKNRDDDMHVFCFDSIKDADKRCARSIQSLLLEAPLLNVHDVTADAAAAVYKTPSSSAK
jgi:hypothetical protein